MAEAIETVESHLHPISSFDLDDHPMPNGREEIWRFTPLKRLKGVLDDAPTADVGDDEESYAATYELVGPEEYFPGTLSPAEAPRGTALVPDDRASAVSLFLSRVHRDMAGGERSVEFLGFARALIQARV